MVQRENIQKIMKSVLLPIYQFMDITQNVHPEPTRSLNGMGMGKISQKLSQHKVTLYNALLETPPT